MKYPLNRDEAEWYSERYGNDILAILSYAIDKEEVFLYVSIENINADMNKILIYQKKFQKI